MTRNVPPSQSPPVLRSLSPLAAAAIRVALLADGLLLDAGALLSRTTGMNNPIHAYLTGSMAFSPRSVAAYLAFLLMGASSIAIAAYLDERSRGTTAHTSSTQGNWWLLLAVPALLDNEFDFFTGHFLFILLFLVIAYLFYSGHQHAWQWGAALGLFIAVFYATDGTGDLLRGGPWNVTAVTLSSGHVTQTLWGLLAFTSDMLVAMLLVLLTYAVCQARRHLVTLALGGAMALTTLPRLVLLPLAGFAAVFSGWVAALATTAFILVLAGIILIVTAPPTTGSERPDTRR